MNAILKQIVETGYTKTPEGESLRVHSGISADEGLLVAFRKKSEDTRKWDFHREF